MELDELGLQASKNHHQPHHLAEGHPLDHANIGRKAPSKSRFAPERSREFDDVSVMSMDSMYQERPRRPGIPRSLQYLHRLWKSPLPKLRKHRNGRDDRRKKMLRLFGEKVPSKATSLSMLPSN
ncbi:hypothetical protein DKX38_029943 [Salix brachista]|uniref:Uncharacterized protein n=1 Tax=Salix brachista TaxID=2182728 RepID=A0A5N5J587_9ROSI|nr:hypothetical protein DKX38_029943 [Salix brachista]